MTHCDLVRHGYDVTCVTGGRSRPDLPVGAFMYRKPRTSATPAYTCSSRKISTRFAVIVSLLWRGTWRILPFPLPLKVDPHRRIRRRVRRVTQDPPTAQGPSFDGLEISGRRDCLTRTPALPLADAHLAHNLLSQGHSQTSIRSSKSKSAMLDANVIGIWKWQKDKMPSFTSGHNVVLVVVPHLHKRGFRHVH